MTQLSLGLAPEPETIPTAAQQRTAPPVTRQRPEISPLVLALIADGTLDFLDRKYLPDGVKEPKVMRKKLGMRKRWL